MKQLLIILFLTSSITALTAQNKLSSEIDSLLITYETLRLNALTNDPESEAACTYAKAAVLLFDTYAKSKKAQIDALRNLANKCNTEPIKLTSNYDEIDLLGKKPDNLLEDEKLNTLIKLHQLEINRLKREKELTKVFNPTSDF